MKKGILMLLSLFILLNVTTAQKKKVYITKSQEGNSIILTAHNDHEIAMNITLKITSSGLDLSAGPTIVKTLAAMSKKKMVTMTPVPGVQATYKYKLSSKQAEELAEIVDTAITTTSSRMVIKNTSSYHGKDAIQNTKNNLDSTKVALFVKEDCDRCMVLIELLKEKNITYQAYNTDKNEKHKQLLWDAMYAYGKKGSKVLMPTIFYKKQAYYDIKDFESLVKKLKE